MAEINLCNSAGRDAVVKLQSLGTPLRVRRLDPEGRQVVTARMIKSSVAEDVDALVEKHGDLRSVAAAVRDGDPEVNVEVAGRLLQESSRVYVDKSRKIARSVQEWDVINNPDGSLRDRRPHAVPDANVGPEAAPLRQKIVIGPPARSGAGRRGTDRLRIQPRHLGREQAGCNSCGRFAP